MARHMGATTRVCQRDREVIKFGLSIEVSGGIVRLIVSNYEGLSSLRWVEYVNEEFKILQWSIRLVSWLVCRVAAIVYVSTHIYGMTRYSVVNNCVK